MYDGGRGVCPFGGAPVTVFVTVGIQIDRILSRLDGATSYNTEQRETTKRLARSVVCVVQSCTVLATVAKGHGLWEQDVGGSNPLAPTNFILPHLDRAWPWSLESSMLIPTVFLCAPVAQLDRASAF